MKRIVKGLAIMAAAVMFCAAIEAGVGFFIGGGDSGYYDDCDAWGNCYFGPIRRRRPSFGLGITVPIGGDGDEHRGEHHGWRH